jgi:very-short-patch-repair endonuclease
MTRHAVVVRARTGRLHRLYRGVYAVGHPAPPVEGRFLAAVKACGLRAVLSHLAAAFLWGLIEDEPEVIDVTVTGGSRVHPGVRVHRCSDLARNETTRRAEIPVTTPARTIVDLAAIVPERELRHLIRRAEGKKRLELEQLVALHRRRARRRGNAKLGRAIALGSGPTRTVLEDVVLDLLLESGFERPDVNVPMRVGGRVVVPDFRWPRQHLIVEADGAAWHDQKIAGEDDAERQALLEAHGERVLRVTWDQAVTKVAETVARVDAAGAPRTHECRVQLSQATKLAVRGG